MWNDKASKIPFVSEKSSPIFKILNFVKFIDLVRKT